MRFLVDQDVYKVTVEFLLKNGHDVLTAREIGMQRASDTELLRKAKGRELIKLSECTELNPAKTMHEKTQMVKLFNSQS